MTGKYWFWLGVALVLAGVPFGRRADAGNALLDPQEAYLGKKSEPVTYRVDLSAVVTPPSKCKVLKVWMPIPPSDEAQQVSGSSFTTFPVKVEARIGQERIFGSVTVCSAPIHRGW